MTTRNKKSIFCIVFLLLIVIAFAAFYVPISSNQYRREDPQNIETSKLEVTRYPLAIKIKTQIVHGACDGVKSTSSIVNGRQVITISTPSESKLCTLQAVYSDTNIKLFSLPWQKNFVVKYYDKVLFDGRL